MNNEIKEILDYFRNIVNDKKETYTVVSRDTIYLEKLLDYITNLQQENNNLKTSLDESQEVVIDLQQENEKLRQELQRKNNIINVIKEELSKDFCTYVCKNRTYGKTFKAGAEVYKEHLLYKIKELESKGEEN